MNQNLRRDGLAAAAVALVFVVYLVLDATVVTIELQRLSAGGGRIDRLDVGFQWGLLIVLTSLIPSVVLHVFRITRPTAYIMVGALSGWFAVYSFWFEFGETFSLPWPFKPKIFQARAFSEVLADAFTAFKLNIPLDSWVFWTIPACCLIGVFCGWLYWFLIVRRLLRKDKALAV